MNTQKTKILKRLAIVTAALISGLVSFNAGAEETMKVIYQPQYANHSIYSYLNATLAKIALKPELIYVSQANGPAIHSYPHSVTEQVASWNVGYVDKAYGPAIYSYGEYEHDGAVKVLPIETE